MKIPFPILSILGETGIINNAVNFIPKRRPPQQKNRIRQSYWFHEASYQAAERRNPHGKFAGFCSRRSGGFCHRCGGECGLRLHLRMAETQKVGDSLRLKRFGQPCAKWQESLRRWLFWGIRFENTAGRRHHVIHIARMPCVPTVFSIPMDCWLCWL